MSKRGLLILLVALALVIQNTCPYGLAEKTAVAAPFTHDCPLKQHHAKDSEGKSSADLQDMQTYLKTFNLLSGSVAYHPLPLKEAETVAAVVNMRYNDGFIDLPIKPPIPVPDRLS